MENQCLLELFRLFSQNKKRGFREKQVSVALKKEVLSFLTEQLEVQTHTHTHYINKKVSIVMFLLYCKRPSKMKNSATESYFKKWFRIKSFQYPILCAYTHPYIWEGEIGCGRNTAYIMVRH